VSIFKKIIVGTITVALGLLILLFGCMWLDVHAGEAPIVSNRVAEIPGDTLVRIMGRGAIGPQLDSSSQQPGMFRGASGGPLPEGMGPVWGPEYLYDSTRRKETNFRGPLPEGMGLWQARQSRKYDSYSARRPMSRDQLDALGMSVEDYRQWMISLQPYDPNRRRTNAYRADGTILGQSPERMAMRTVVIDSVQFDDDSLATITLNRVPTNTQRRTAPTSSDKITVGGPFTIEDYNETTGIVTVKALFAAGSTYVTVSLNVQ